MKPIGFDEQDRPLSGDLVIQHIREKTDTVLLSFSTGKDSIVAWLKLREVFKVIPYYMYIVPHLPFIEKSLAYYENYFGVRIIRVPNPNFYRQLNALVFQTPERIKVIQAARLPLFDNDMLAQYIREDYQLSDCVYVATGIRAADSPNRRAAINTYGPINEKRKTFYPVWDLNKDGVIKMLQDAKIKLPVDYELFGRTLDGLDYRFIKPIKDNLPDDYQVLKEWFPLLDLAIVRYELSHEQD